MNELKPISDKQLKLMFKLINDMPEATTSEVGLVDASDVFDMLFKCNNPKFIDEYIREMGKLNNRPTISLSPEFLSRIDMIECRLSKLEWTLNHTDNGSEKK